MVTLIAAIVGPTQSARVSAVGIERASMVAVIDVLDCRSLVERHLSPVDGRFYELVLGAEGSDMLEQLKLMVLKHEKRVTINLDPEERSQLLRILSKLTHERHRCLIISLNKMLYIYHVYAMNNLNSFNSASAP